MKTVCLIDYNMSVRGGVEQVTAALANALVDHCRVFVVSLCTTGSLDYLLDDRVTFLSITDHDPGLKKLLLKAVPFLTRFFRQHGVDVAIVQGNYPGFVVSPLRFFSKTKLVFCDHGALMNQWDNRKIRTIRKLASRLCHKTVTLTEQSRGDYVRQFCLDETRVECIYNWIDLDKPHASSYNAVSKRIVSAGRFGKEKGFDMLVTAYAPLVERFPDWHLDIFGDGEMMETVHTLVNTFGLSDNVHLLGMRNDLAERYGDYAFYVLPSYREGMPLVLLEAKANHLPIVSFDIMTGPREIVRDGLDGTLVPPYDLDALGEAMATLMQNEALRVSMAERSQDTLETFSKETILQQWITLIESL